MIKVCGVYRAVTQGDGGQGRSNTVIGYYAGNQEDIKEYLKEKAMWYVELEPITIHSITSAMIEEKRKKDQEKQQLLKRLKELEEV